MLAHAMRRAIKVSLKHYKFRSSSFEFYSHSSYFGRDFS